MLVELKKGGGMRTREIRSRARGTGKRTWANYKGLCTEEATRIGIRSQETT